MLRLLILSTKNKAYLERFWQRLGCIPTKKDKQKLIWLHAVSVGEVVATKKIVKNIIKEYPDYKIVITTGTPTGSETVKQLYGENVTHFYQPYDLACIVKRYLNRLQPNVFIVMETELWPNLFHYCHKRQIPVLLVNARMSERSARRYKRFSSLANKLMQSITAITAQSQSDAERLLELGALAEKIHVTGSIKFDINISDEQLNEVKKLKQQQLKGRPVWIAASTHQGEELLATRIHQTILKKIPDCLLILAPRHTNRSQEISQLLSSENVQYILRSSKQAILPECQILLVDTMGELMTLYGLSDVAFVGGSLVNHGGHNPIEPAYWSIPILIGPHDFNFLEIGNSLIEHNAAIRVMNQNQLEQSVCKLLSDNEFANELGQNALSFINKSKGSSQKIWNIIRPYSGLIILINTFGGIYLSYMTDTLSTDCINNIIFVSMR